jgi:nucleotide-binding universal stress UspA family protein
VLVAIGESRASLEALSAAGVYASQRKMRLVAIHVIEVKRALPLDADLDAESRRGEQLLRRAEGIAHEKGFAVEGELLQARDAGQAIVEEAKTRGAELIVLGAGYRRLIGQFDLGKTADYVLRHALCQVWLVREAVGADE